MITIVYNCRVYACWNTCADSHQFILFLFLQYTCRPQTKLHQASSLCSTISQSMPLTMVSAAGEKWWYMLGSEQRTGMIGCHSRRCVSFHTSVWMLKLLHLSLNHGTQNCFTSLTHCRLLRLFPLPQALGLAVPAWSTGSPSPYTTTAPSTTSMCSSTPWCGSSSMPSSRSTYGRWVWVCGGEEGWEEPFTLICACQENSSLSCCLQTCMLWGE